MDIRTIELAYGRLSSLVNTRKIQKTFVISTSNPNDPDAHSSNDLVWKFLDTRKAYLVFILSREIRYQPFTKAVTPEDLFYIAADLEKIFPSDYLDSENTFCFTANFVNAHDLEAYLEKELTDFLEIVRIFAGVFS